jgi:hypothetical protein
LSKITSGVALTIEDEVASAIADEEDDSVDEGANERCTLEEETGTASDDNAAEDHSGESCADDPPNVSQESGEYRSDEHDSIIVDSDMFESPHATNTAKIVMHAPEKKE